MADPIFNRERTMSKYTRRPDGLYQKSVTLGRRPDGKYYRKTIYAKTVRELEEKAAEYRRKYRVGTLSADENMTFGEAAAAWLSVRKVNCSAATRAMYQNTVDVHLNPVLANLKLLELRPHHLHDIINGMSAAGLSSSTMKKVKITAAAILEYAIENDVLYRNVFKAVSVPSVPAAHRRALTEYEIGLISSTWSGHRLGVPALLMLYCGLRRGELLALTWNDIDLDEKALTVSKAVKFVGNTPVCGSPKTQSSYRAIPIPDAILPVLRKNTARSLLVCPASGGGLMTKQAFRCAWSSYLNYLNNCAGGRVASRTSARVQAIDPNITPHMLRHTYATILYDSSVDVKSAQLFLGHADIQTTLGIYTHLSEQKQGEAVARLNGHLKNRAVKIQ